MPIRPTLNKDLPLVTTIEAIGTIFGVICVILYTRQNILSWPAGLIQVALFIVVFYEAKLYSDLILHVIYVGLQIYGWYHWAHGGASGDALPVTRTSRSELTRWIIVGVVGSIIVGALMSNLTDAAAPYPDAAIAVVSLIAQWLITRKKLESWLFWIFVDIVAIGVYLSKDLYYLTALYVLFLALAIVGYRSWRRDHRTLHRDERDDTLRADPREVRAAS